MKNRLRVFRSEIRKTQHQLRLETGINQTKLSLIENDLVEPTQDEKKKLARALGSSVDKIFGDQRRISSMKIRDTIKGIKVTVPREKEIAHRGSRKGYEATGRGQAVIRECTPEDVLSFDEETGILITIDGQKHHIYR